MNEPKISNGTAEIEAAIDSVLGSLDASDTFKTRLRQLVRNAIGENLAESDIRSAVAEAPTDYSEGT